LVIGAIDARPPRPEPPAGLPDLDRQIEALHDERGALDDKIAAATARRTFAERFAESAPAGLGDKGEARPLSDWRAAFAAIAEEVALADAAIREAGVRQRDIDREKRCAATAGPDRDLSRWDLRRPWANETHA
jgi:hypothetical protein